MKTTAAIVITFLAVALAFAQTPAERQGARPEIIVDRAASDIFPESWIKSRISAKAEPLNAEVQKVCREIVEKALAKYPAAVLAKNLKNVFVLGKLDYFGVSTGGSNSKNAVYVVSNEKYKPADLERNLHAEFSSILLRNFPQHLDQVAWQQINPPDFHYRGTGVAAVRNGQASLRLKAELHEEGFVNEYGKASIEEDFNSFAGRLFEGHPGLWSALEKYPKVKAKAELVIAFYGKLDASLTTEFFASVRQNDTETRPDYSRYTQSYRVPFANTKGVDFDKLQTLLVRVSINGGPPLLVQADNGSNGVIIGAGDVPNIEPNAPAGSINYVSSGVELRGVWTPATVTFLDAKDEHGNVATALVPVLAVNERIAREGAVNSGKFKTTKNPKIYMLGVGSGRGKEAHQEKNPFVNLKEMQAGTMRRGYTITREGFTLGLTAQSVGDGYLFEKLHEHVGTNAPARTSPPVPKDWDGSLGWAVVGEKKTETCSMLLDTGLTNMMIELPSVDAQSDVAAGTEVSVHLLSGRLSYSFKVGDFTNPVTPRKVTWVKYTPGPLINTGLRVLAHYDYLYDADGGWLGLRPVNKAP